MSEKRYREDLEGAAASMPAPLVPGRMPASAKLFPGAMLMRKARDASSVAAGAEDAVARASSSSGAALPGEVRDRFESSLGADLSSVRVHTGASSAEAASSVGAKAYTIGNDIHFAEGQYAPTDPFGLHLLAHEVAHTQQQAGGSPVRQNKLEVSSAGDAAEVEADQAADAMVSGAGFAIGGVGHGIQRKETEGSVGANVGVNKKGAHVNLKVELSKEFPAKWVVVEVGGSYTVAGELARKGGEAPKAGEGGEAPKPGDAPPAAAAGGDDGPSEDVKHQAESQGSTKLKSTIESKAEKEKDWDLKLDTPEVELGTGGAGTGGVTVKAHVAGKEVLIKGNLIEVKKGKIELPNIEVEVPFELGETKLWENDRFELTVKNEIAVKVKVKPNLEEIGKWVMEEVLKKTATTVAEDIPTGAGAIGASQAIAAAGGIAIVASVFYAWHKSIEEGVEMSSTVAAGKKEIDDIVAAAMQGLTGESSDPGGAAVHSQFLALCKNHYDALKPEEKKSTTLADYQAAASKGVQENADRYRKQFASQVGPQVAAKYAQAYYDKHRSTKSDKLTDKLKDAVTTRDEQAQVIDAQTIYNQICGGSPSAFHPGGGVSTPSVKIEDHTQHGGDPSVHSEHFNDDARRATFEGIQQKIDPTRNKAYSEGNTLALWLQKDPKPGAIDAHNEGSAHLKYGETQVALVKTPDDMATFGEFAVEAYEAACGSFEKGLALYPPGRPPA